MAYVDRVYHGGKNYAEQMTDEHLCCVLCRVPGFRQPKLLQCGHTFCCSCLDDYSRLGNMFRGALMCPTCHQPNPLPPGGVGAITNNLFVDNQVDRLLRRHNQDRGRDDTFYNISAYEINNCGHAQFNKN